MIDAMLKMAEIDTTRLKQKILVEWPKLNQ